MLVFGACLYAVSNLIPLHSYEQTKKSFIYELRGGCEIAEQSLSETISDAKKSLVFPKNIVPELGRMFAEAQKLPILSNTQII